MKFTSAFVLIAMMGTGCWTASAQAPGGLSTNLPPGATDKPLPGMSTNAINPQPPPQGAPQGGRP